MESREEIRARLKREGRWSEFVELRESLKSDGMSPKDAWEQARQTFSPLSDEQIEEQESANNTCGISLSQFDGKAKVSARSVVEWVFDYIDVEDVTPDMAPSPGAWSFLQRVRKYPDLLKEFYRSIWSKMLPTKSEIESSRKFEDDGREQIKLIDRVARASRNSVL
ncbi:MAG: hypothetical protein NTX52_05320 [Planctomycetota bacterium]|nr:hypothetical protein [Planctomycetota bacterium]